MRKKLLYLFLLPVFVIAFIHYYFETSSEPPTDKGVLQNREALNSLAYTNARSNLTKPSVGEVLPERPLVSTENYRPNNLAKDEEIKFDSTLADQAKTVLKEFGFNVPEAFELNWQPGMEASLVFSFIDVDGKPRELKVAYHYFSREIWNIYDSRDTENGSGFEPWIEKNLTAKVEHQLEDKVKQHLEAKGSGQVQVKGLYYSSRLTTFDAIYKVKKANDTNNQTYWVADVTFDKQTMEIDKRFWRGQLKRPEWPMDDEEALQRLRKTRRHASN